MNENLNLCEILKDCPAGTKLWSPVWGNVTLMQINDTSIYPIILSAVGFNYISLRSDGKMYDGIKEAECLLFPSKNQRDWSKFKAPVEKPKVPTKKFNPEEFKPFDHILVRDGNGLAWIPSLFDRILKEPTDEGSVVELISEKIWEQCIPYNNETKELVRTSDDCPDYYKWWEE